MFPLFAHSKSASRISSKIHMASTLNLACSALTVLMLAPLASRDVQGAVLQRFDAGNDLQTNIKDSGTDARAETMSALSGSPWPGVIDHLLQSPLTQSRGNNQAGIHINYPSFGHRNVDADIRAWVETIAATFQTHLDTDVLASVTGPESYELDHNPFFQDDDLNSEEAAKAISTDNDFELWGTYTVSRPSDNAVSITYELWNYLNNNTGNLDIITLNYNLLNGQRLNFVDIFEKPDLALKLMSSWSRKKLGGRLGEGSRSSMLNSGTEPLLDNFSSLTLTPEGLRINFQPWQVAPGAAGVQKVDMPLEELLEASPLLSLWGQTENALTENKEKL